MTEKKVKRGVYNSPYIKLNKQQKKKIMAIRKIYTSGNQELEIGWTKEGIHLFIKTEGVLNEVEFTIEPYDIDDVLEDIQIYRDGVFDAIRGLQKKEG